HRAARGRASPVSGMPILDVDQAKSIVVIKRSMGRGYAGIDNELYTNEKTGMLFADAKERRCALPGAVGAPRPPRRPPAPARGRGGCRRDESDSSESNEHARRSAQNAQCA